LWRSSSTASSRAPPAAPPAAPPGAPPRLARGLPCCGNARGTYGPVGTMRRPRSPPLSQPVMPWRGCRTPSPSVFDIPVTPCCSDPRAHGEKRSPSLGPPPRIPLPPAANGVPPPAAGGGGGAAGQVRGPDCGAARGGADPPLRRPRHPAHGREARPEVRRPVRDPPPTPQCTCGPVGPRVGVWIVKWVPCQWVSLFPFG